MPQDFTVHWDATRVNGRAHEGAVRGIKLASEHLLGEANKRVPLEEGTLSRSGVATVDEAKLEGAVSYDTVYAVYQHEELTLRHDPGRTAKYLEGPAHEEADTIRDLIAAQVRRALR